MTGVDAYLTSSLEPGQVAAVRELAAAATRADGGSPLDEHARLALTGGPEARHLLRAGRSGDLLGYARLDPGPEATADLVVAPRHRRHGYGAALLDQILGLAGGSTVRMWSHGDHPGASVLARGTGFERVREMWRMRRAVSGPDAAPLPAPEPPEGIAVRTFRPGADDDAWLALNAAAFAEHPEQGGWDRDDLHARLAEPWFDPEGLFLAERAGTLVGFHWTKLAPGDGDPGDGSAGDGSAGDGSPGDGSPGDGSAGTGEIYVLGVHPTAGGRGLGRALALIGLEHLRRSGAGEAMLYVESDNAPAVRLYRRLGFERDRTDVQYRRPGHA